MERIIKFRGLTATNEWVYGDLTHDAPNSTAYYGAFSQRIHWIDEKGRQCNQPVKNGTVGQFTGSFDGFGKEIYDEDYGEDAGGNICHTFWNESSSGFDADFPNAEMFSLNDVAGSIKIIGNKFDNPELNKGEK